MKVMGISMGVLFFTMVKNLIFSEMKAKEWTLGNDELEIA